MPDFGRWTSNGGDPSLNDVNRVDRFFDALGSNETAYSTDHAEAELAFLFADWRDEVRTAPVTAPVTTRDAVDALNAGLGARKRGRSTLVLVGSAAAAVLCIGGFGAAVYSAGPGDAFYGIRSSLFGEQATRDDAVMLAAQAEMQQVQKLIDDGQWEQAQDKLVALSSTVQSVETPEQKQQLVDQYNQLTVKVVEQDPAATLPPDAPLPTFTDSPLTLLPIPTFQVGDTTTSTTSETSGTTSTEPSDTTTTSTSTTTSPSDSATTSTPGPEVMLTTPPTSSGDASSNPATTPPSTPPSGTTTTTTRVEVTSVTSVPSAPPSSQAPPPPSPRSEPSQAPPPSVVPTRAPQSVPAPPPASSVPAEAPAPVEAPSSERPAPKPPRVEEPAPVTTTVAPPS
ncbi:anti-sigma-D factor RsdA [Mycolicibacterium arenosum]|uniref:Anti-sigma-D factor RsdA n=1 Tax=Mycolicibacterium arenosum TaxID=2952157 RepID=A0ABT1MCV0_9MYCO|nr:anti-sigma-D factor RsdA [Mycolicibacterium sp. CAU 1645]MCP9276697.1 anti-sigma-D factor RsdA [Mycolicibacterium sp. CAU 1645]